jgi:hypothetical protein
MPEKNGESCLEQIISLTDVASLCGMGERHVQRLTKSGLIKLARDEKGRLLHGRYVLGEALPTLFEYTRDQAVADDPDERLYRSSRARKMTAIAESEELRLRFQRGELLDGKQVDREVMSVLGMVKNHVLALPTRCARLLAPYTGGGENTKIVRKIMTEAARSTLTEASKFNVGKLSRQRKIAPRTSTHANGEDDED